MNIDIDLLVRPSGWPGTLPGMRVNYQMVVECVDAPRMAAFWSRALGWTIERQNEHMAALRDPDADPADGFAERGRWILVGGGRPKLGKNRVHLDFRISTVEDRDAEVARLIELGATKLWDGREGEHTWVTLADPEGNEFCLL
jgi:predicted enzyme related to lactoylglutathione lyase